MHHFAEEVGQAKVATEMPPREFEVIQAEQMQDRRMQVMTMDFAGDGTEAEVVGLALHQATLHFATGQPGAKTVGLIFATVLLDGSSAAEVLAPRGATELTAPDDERVF